MSSSTDTAALYPSNTHHCILILAGMLLVSTGWMTNATAIQTSSSTPQTTGTKHPEDSPTLRYRITDLGTLPGADDGSAPASMNDKGQVVGTARYRSSKSRAFLWSGGKMTDLGTLGGQSSEAFAINNAGQVVGQAQVVSGYRRAFLWQKGRINELPGGKDASTSNNSAIAINASGQIIGESNNRGVRWHNGQHTSLGGLLLLFGNESGAINDQGQVIGHLLKNGQRPVRRHACLWNKGKLSDLGTLGGAQSYARAINNRGQIVGVAGKESAPSPVKPGSFHDDPEARVDIVTRAFLWENSKMKDLGTLGGPNSEAWAVNDKGEVVGAADTQRKAGFGGNIRSAFVYTEGKMYELSRLIPADSGWVLEAAIDINNNGQIVGVGYMPSRRDKGKAPRGRAFLLTPK